MSFEEKLHKKIEEGNAEEKQRAIVRLSSEIDFPNEKGEVRVENGKRKALIICSVGFAFFLFLLIFCIAFFGRKDRMRYCEASDYFIAETSQTLGEYSKDHGGKILYFDWYDVTSFHGSYVVKLNDTQEIICFIETIFDENSGYEIVLSVTDNHTIIDSLETYDIICGNIEESATAVKWGDDFFDSFAMFEQKDYRYFLQISDSDRPELARDYALQLLNS